MTSTDGTPTPAPTPASNALRAVLYLIAAFQFVLGVAFLLAPQPTAEALGLPPAPAWTGWLFAMMAARFLGYGVGLVAAARDPLRHRLWIRTMAAVQAIDWLATVPYLAQGAVTPRQVLSAAFMPLLFATALVLLDPSRGRRTGLVPTTLPERR